MWEARSPNYTVLFLFLHECSDIKTNIFLKESHRCLYTDKEGEQESYTRLTDSLEFIADWRTWTHPLPARLDFSEWRDVVVMSEHHLVWLARLC